MERLINRCCRSLLHIPLLLISAMRYCPAAAKSRFSAVLSVLPKVPQVPKLPKGRQVPAWPVLAVWAVLGGWSLVSHAQSAGVLVAAQSQSPMQPSTPTPTMAQSAAALSFASAAPSKGYSRLFANINAVCGAKLPLKEINTSDGLDNLIHLSEKNATLGIAQYDTWAGLSVGDESIKNLKGLATLSYSLMHIVVLAGGTSVVEGKRCEGGKAILGKCVWGNWKDSVSTVTIKNETQLKGHTVAAVGAAQGLARNFLNKHMDLGLKIVDVAPTPSKSAEALALDKLKSGEVQAVLIMGSYPESTISLLKNSDKPREKMALATFNSTPGKAFRVVKKNYKNLDAYNLPFLAVPNILWARPVDPNGETGKQIHELQNCLSANLQTLQDKEGFESGWTDASMAVPDTIGAWNAAAKAKP
jgi:TRAP-type uncharacterized transport system substrate-binding protein